MYPGAHLFRGGVWPSSLPSPQVDTFATNVPKDTKPVAFDKSAPSRETNRPDFLGRQSRTHSRAWKMLLWSQIPTSRMRLFRHLATITTRRSCLTLGDSGLKGRDYDYETDLGSSGSHFQEDGIVMFSTTLTSTQIWTLVSFLPRSCSARR